MKNNKVSFYFTICLISFLLLINLSAIGSSKQFIKGNDTLIVYTDVPELESSTHYTVRVRSAATNNEWVECFVNFTENIAYNKTLGMNYFGLTDGWTHSFSTIEMSRNFPIEVEVSSKNNFKINGSNFLKASVHPSHKASKATVDAQGVIRFIMSNPANVSVDINGQMDDYIPISDVPGNDVTDPLRPKVHVISIFASPIIEKPKLDDSEKIMFVEPGVKPSSDLGSKSTLYFKPGIHNVGLAFKLQAGKNYFIPGDAIVYGTFNNLGMPGIGALTSGQNIKIYGYGTICGDKINHPDYDGIGLLPSEEACKPYKAIHIENAINSGAVGIQVLNSPYHSVQFVGSGTYCKWVKVITWRANGDGIGSCNLMEDCYLRTNDDCSYVKGNKKRCVFWKDGGGAIFHMAGIPENNTALVIEDCDVLYLRGRVNAMPGKGLFSQRGRGAVGQRTVNVLFKDFRIHDKHPNQTFFQLNSTDRTIIGSSFKGITFQNISAVAAYNGYGLGKSQLINGASESPWYGGITFDNCTVGGKLLTINNFSVNQFVKDILFISSPIEIAVKSNSAVGGSVSGGGKFKLNGTITVVASPNKDYKFESWKYGDLVVSTDSSYSFEVLTPKTLTAFFSPITNVGTDIHYKHASIIEIYPNPAKDKLYIKGNNQKINNIQIIDLSGKSILSLSNVSVYVDVSKIERGLYIIKVQTDNNVISKKLKLN